MYRAFYIIYLLSSIASGEKMSFDIQVLRSPKYSISHCLNDKMSFNVPDETFYVEAKSNVLLQGFYFLIMAKNENTGKFTLSNYSVVQNFRRNSYIDRYEVHIPKIKYVKRRFIYFVFYAEDLSYAQTPYTSVSCMVFIDNDADAPRMKGEPQGVRGTILITGNMEDTTLPLAHLMKFKYLDDYFLLFCCEHDRNMNCIRQGEVKMESQTANGMVIYNILSHPILMLSRLVNGLQYECTKNIDDVTSLTTKTMTTTFQLVYSGGGVSNATSVLHETTENTTEIIRRQNSLISSFFEIPINYPDTEENKTPSTEISTTNKNEYIPDVNVTLPNASVSTLINITHDIVNEGDHNVPAPNDSLNINVSILNAEESTTIDSTVKSDSHNDNVPVTDPTVGTETNGIEINEYDSNNNKRTLNATDGVPRGMTCDSWSNFNAVIYQIMEYEINDTLEINCTMPTTCYFTLWRKHDSAIMKDILGACYCGEDFEDDCSLNSNKIILSAMYNNICYYCKYNSGHRNSTLKHSLRKLILKPNNRINDVAKPDITVLIGVGCGAALVVLIGLILCWQCKVLERLRKCRSGAGMPPGHPSHVLTPQDCDKQVRAGCGQQLPLIPRPVPSRATPPLYVPYEEEYEAIDYDQCHVPTNPPNESSRLVKPPAPPPIHLMPGKNGEHVQVRWKPPNARRPAYTDSELMQLDDDGYQIPITNKLTLLTIK